MIKTAGLVGFAGPAESPIVPWRSSSVGSGAIAIEWSGPLFCGTKDAKSQYSREERS